MKITKLRSPATKQLVSISHLIECFDNTDWAVERINRLYELGFIEPNYHYVEVTCERCGQWLYKQAPPGTLIKDCRQCDKVISMGDVSTPWTKNLCIKPRSERSWL